MLPNVALNALRGSESLIRPTEAVGVTPSADTPPSYRRPGYARGAGWVMPAPHRVIVLFVRLFVQRSYCCSVVLFNNENIVHPPTIKFR